VTAGLEDRERTWLNRRRAATLEAVAAAQRVATAAVWERAASCGEGSIRVRWCGSPK
jgi:hypothetical protein